MMTESTASELRKTGISVIGDVPWGTHFCCFYETKEDLLETLVLYFKEGLESKEFCVWVVSQALTLKEARTALAEAVPDLERYLADGALEIAAEATESGDSVLFRPPAGSVVASWHRPEFG
jgi:DcmR-like sensory protein